MVEPTLGSRAQTTFTVGEADLAPALGTGNVPVLATWRIVALFEQVAHEAIAQVTDTALTSVARQVQIDHLAPVAEGRAVIAEAVLERVEGRRLVFSCRALADERLVAVGRVVRVLVRVEHFLAHAR
jgi:fluoroacetyl-CoA thioesterase